MDQFFAQQADDALLPSPLHNPLDWSKTPNYNTQFEKNYPKNIFIPIIEYLADIGFQNDYESCVGTREEFEGKNVVSLTLIHKLLNERWFQKHINKKVLQANISNKILINSKIKKKLFHLKMARILLQTHTPDPKEFKKIVSKKANAIPLQLEENDEIFTHPSSILYLLNLFLSILKNYTPSKIIQTEEEDEAVKSPQLNSKEEFKNLTKKIVMCLGKINLGEKKLRELEINIRDTIMQRSFEINRKYNLPDGCPNWEQFIEIVVRRCINYKMGSSKIPNSLLSQWIFEFKHKCTQFGVRKYQEERTEELMISPEFKPIILVMPPLQMIG